MKVAAPYTIDGRWKNLPDEYNIEYTETGTLQKLIDFCELYPNKRINILFKNDIDFEILNVINKIHNNLYIRIINQQIPLIKKLQEENIKFFFDETLPCSSLGLLDYMLKLGVTDIYIYDTLCYLMPSVKKRCEEAGVQIRLVLNKIPAFQLDAGSDYRAPIFTPRDMEILEQYIDVAEFDCFKENGFYDWHKFNVFYNAWIKEWEWVGPLSEIMPEVDIEIPVYSLPPNSAQRKIACGRKCSLGNSCAHCQQLIHIAQILHLKDGYIKNRNKNRGKEE